MRSVTDVFIIVSIAHYGDRLLLRKCYETMNLVCARPKSLTSANHVPNDRELRFILALLILAPRLSFAQAGEAPPAPSEAPAASAGDQPSFWDRFWVSIQGNFIRQEHPTFDAKYSGPNSFLPDAEHATSRVETLFTGFQISNRLEILCDLESAGGAGLSNALGIAGFTNVDVVRNPTLSENPYVS